MCKYLVEKIAEANLKHNFVITGSENIPKQVLAAKITEKEEFETSHEEADLIIVQQCYKLVNDEGCSAIRILSDDIDVFALSCYFFPVDKNDIVVYMEASSKGRSIIDIGVSKGNCMCRTSKIGCSIFCKYFGTTCFNPYTSRDTDTNLTEYVDDVDEEE